MSDDASPLTQDLLRVLLARHSNMPAVADALTKLRFVVDLGHADTRDADEIAAGRTEAQSSGPPWHHPELEGIEQSICWIEVRVAQIEALDPDQRAQALSAFTDMADNLLARSLNAARRLARLG